MTRTSNHFVGDQEYLITFENGSHCVKRVEGDNLETIFIDHYPNCLDYISELHANYLENQW
jgi:hypothetical protein